MILVSGARPNFMKVAPLIWELNRRRRRSAAFPISFRLVHTGQHYGRDMMNVFFNELGLSPPDYNLGVGSGSHAVQTAKIMIAFERVCRKETPDLVLVVGDVNSTIACTLVAAKLGIRTAHLEAGLRSRDLTMPEEINRILTDAIADMLLTSCLEANKNLAREGVSPKRVFFVGNIMIDCLVRNRRLAEKLAAYRKLGYSRGGYAVLTLHRPSNVDARDTLENILSALHQVARDIPILFPVHPRTRKQLERYGLGRYFEGDSSLIPLEPLGYLEFLSLNMGSKFVLTDSGGIQEETTALGIPCLTLRDNTERSITVSKGTNRVIGIRPERIVAESRKILRGKWKSTKGTPELWDGRTAARVIDILERGMVESLPGGERLS